MRPPTDPSQPGCPVIEFEASRTTDALSGRRQLGPQPLDQRDRAEEVHRHHQRRVDTGESGDPGGRYDPVDDLGERLYAGDRGPPAVGGREVGEHIGVPQVDGQHPVALLAQHRCGGGADPEAAPLTT